jgi:hypothetical protein
MRGGTFIAKMIPKRIESYSLFSEESYNFQIENLNSNKKNSFGNSR